MKTIRVGSRDSALAVAQSRLVMAAARRRRPDLDFELVTMKTSGDKILDRPLEAIGGKGLFVKELDAALASGRVDVCVHSFKDMPTPDNPELPVWAVLPREDPRDALVSPEGGERRDLPLGTASPRRRAQLAEIFPGWRCEPIRGNLQTRIGKLDAGLFGGLALAAAGLKRMGLWGRAARVFSPDEMLPAACQGIIAVQGRSDGDYGWLAEIDDPDSRDAATAERAFVEGVEGGCTAPIAAYAEVRGDELRLRAFHVDAAGRNARGERRGKRNEAGAIGLALARELRREGGGCG